MTALEDTAREIEIIDKMQEFFRREKRERVQRCVEYSEIATKRLELPTTVEYCRDIPVDRFHAALGVSWARGDITRLESSYRIRLVPDLPLNIEHSVLMHEFGHALLGHAVYSTPEQKQEAQEKLAVLFSPELRKILPPSIDPVKMFREDTTEWYVERERQANVVGAALLAAHFPGEVYDA